MPHHSKQLQPPVMEGGVYHPASDPHRPHTSNKPHSDSFPLPSERQRMGIQPPTTGPPSRSMNWPTAGGEVPPNLYHRVPQSPDIQKLVRHPPVNVNTATGETTTDNHGPSVASVLLLAAAAQQKADEQQQQLQEQSESAGDHGGSSVYSQHHHSYNDRESYLHSPATSALSPGQTATTTATAAMTMEGSRPLKKRKMDAERTQTSSSSPCNVSPMSQYSKSGVCTAETSACETETVCTTASGSSSYEDTGNKDDEQVAGTGNAEPQQQQQQQQDSDSLLTGSPQPSRATKGNHQRQSLPVALHWLLTESTSPALEHAAAVRTVLHWLPHGQAWKIIRWDAFRRQILPRFFPEFRLTDGTVSVDAFLSEVTAWGFEEIRDGPDVGAFAHTLFRRGHPQLCLEMTFSPTDKPKVFSPETRSILRVPSLGSTEGSSTTNSKKDSFYGSTPPVFVNYREDDEWRGPQQSSSSSARTCYSPIRIRSGRGARRQAPPVSPAPPTVASSTYPVSSRGRRKQSASPEPRSKKKLPLTGAVAAS